MPTTPTNIPPPWATSYRFALPSPTHILGLPIGQHISIGAVLDQPDGSHKEIVRSYTPISGDELPGFVDLLIKSYPTGNISKYLASVAVGQTIRVRGPKGAFTYRPNLVRHFGMIAGGTGITPMLQVVKAIIRGRAAGDRTEVDLIFANVTDKDILLKEDLDALAAEDKGFRVHYVLDKPPANWTGGVGYVTSEMITVCVCSGRCSLCVCDDVVVITMANADKRNGCPRPLKTSRFCCAVLLLWSVGSRRLPRLSATRRLALSASLRIKSLLSRYLRRPYMA